jgi:hypothetical protein
MYVPESGGAAALGLAAAVLSGVPTGKESDVEAGSEAGVDTAKFAGGGRDGDAPSVGVGGAVTTGGLDADGVEAEISDVVGTELFAVVGGVAKEVADGSEFVGAAA